MSILRNSVYFFGAPALFAIAAFWPSYPSRIAAVEELHVHAHGVVMASWLLMLIAQAFLIRTDRRPTHRPNGKVSYVLAPLVVLSPLSLMHLRLADSGEAPSRDLLYFSTCRSACSACSSFPMRLPSTTADRRKCIRPTWRVLPCR